MQYRRDIYIFIFICGVSTGTALCLAAACEMNLVVFFVVSPAVVCEWSIITKSFAKLVSCILTFFSFSVTNWKVVLCEEGRKIINGSLLFLITNSLLRNVFYDSREHVGPTSEIYAHTNDVFLKKKTSKRKLVFRSKNVLV